MFDLPPDPSAFDTDPVIERLTECGLQRGGLTVTYDDLLQETVVTIGASAGASAEHFGCIRESLRFAYPEFEVEGIGTAYWEFVAEQERPRQLAETRDRLESMGLLEGFPQRSSFVSFAEYVGALEVHAGVTEGSYLTAYERSVSFAPPHADPDEMWRDHFEERMRIITVVFYASLIEDFEFGFIGNELAAED